MTSGVPVAKERLRQEVRTGNRIEVAGLMLLVILCLFLAMPEFKDESTHEPLLLGSISGLLDSEPVITESGHSRTRTIEIRLKEYPEFEFVVNSLAMQVADEKAFVSYARQGYPMQLAIPVAHYETKFAHLRKPTFWEKHTSYYTIPVAGFKDDRHTYLWPEKLAGLKTDYTVLRIMAVVGALYFIMLIIKKARTSRY